MKKILFLKTIFILSLSVCACNIQKPEEETEMKNTQTETIRINFKNKVKEADVWILPNTKENRELTIWGTPTVANSIPEIEYTAELEKSIDDDYILHMIDIDEMYYGSGTITLSNDYSVIVSRDEYEILLEICDDTGKIIFKDYIFSAAL